MPDLSTIELIVIGASAGGLHALQKILPALKRNGKLKIAVVIHLPAEGPNLIPSVMSTICPLEVSEAEAGEPMESDHIYIAPCNYHLCVEPGFTLSLSSEEAIHYSRPSIDVLFESAAYSSGKQTLGILLTGANHDGARGLQMIKEQGGLTIVQDPSEAEYKTMPQSALDLMKPNYVYRLQEISSFLSKLTQNV